MPTSFEDADAALVALERILLWLQQNAPPIAERIAGPASADTLAELDAALAIASECFENGLPLALKRLLSRCDGGRGSGFLPGGPDFDDCPFDLLPAADIMAERQMWIDNAQEDLDDWLPDPDDIDPEVRRVAWDNLWLPFAELGGNVLCLDYNPTEAGTAGQVISHNHENGGTRRLSISLADYLSAAADAFEAGRYVLEHDYLIIAE